MNLFTKMLFTVLFIGGPVMAKVEIIAHRGASDAAPENTSTAFVLAWQKNSDAAECDIRLTEDNKVVICHDPSAKRTAGVDVMIKDANSCDLLQLDFGAFKGPKFAGEKIPFLADVMKTIPPRSPVFCGNKMRAGNNPVSQGDN